MSRNKKTWDTKENAEAYDGYARNFPMYRDTSRDLVEIAGIKPGMVVVDLAAGTGVTTQAILERIDEYSNVILVDQAEEMLNKAREKFPTASIKFVVSQAEELDEKVDELVDMVICNSAFWQMKAKSTFRAVSNILKDGGIFAFNLPDSFFSYEKFKKQPINPAPYSFNDLVTFAKDVGLTFVSDTVKSYEKTIEEALAFNEIPVMKRNFQTNEEKEAYLTKLRENQNQKREWVYFVFKK